MKSLTACLAGVLVLLPGTVGAQSPVPEARTAGVIFPHGDVASSDHAEAVEVNPAGLAYGEKFQLSYTFLGAEPNDPHHGHAILGSFALGSAYQMGFGYHWVAPDTGDAAIRKSTWSHGLKLGDRVAIGLSRHTFEGGSLDGIETYDFGIQARPGRWISAGLTAHDLEGPGADSGILRRNWLVGLAIRPGTTRLLVSGRARIFEEADRDTEWGGSLQLRLYGRMGLVARYDRELAEGEPQHRFMVGISDWGAVGGGLFFSSPSLGDADSRSGVAISGRIRSRSAALPSLLPRPLVAELVVDSTAEYTTVGFLTQKGVSPFLSLLRKMRKIERHPEVSAVIISFANGGFGWAQAAELRDAIERIRAAGKKVYAWVPVASTRVYSVAAAADAIYTAPAGGLLLTGIQSQMTNLGVLLRRLGIKAQFIAAGGFKTAPELFTRDTPSPAAIRMQNSLLDDLYGRLVGHIARGRGVTPDKAREWIDGGPYTADESRTVGLTEGVMHYDDFEKVIRQDLGPRARFADVGSLLNVRNDRWSASPEIAVLYATGTLVDGDSGTNPFMSTTVTGADTFARAADRIRKDGDVKAVVLRVDSPGGSVTAAERMWHAVNRLAAKKPVVVSFGDIAASGGYYIAGPGREILAKPESITGSIGVFLGKFNRTGLYEGLGIKETLFLRGKNAGLRSLSSDWTESEAARARLNADTLYSLFLDRVDAGRPSMTRAQIEPLAGGRVWTGAQANSCGLVDRDAGLMTAIDLAAQTAVIGDGEYVLGVYPRSGSKGTPRSPFGQISAALADLFLDPVSEKVEEFGPVLRVLRPLLSIPALQFQDGTPLALLPFAWD